MKHVLVSALVAIGGFSTGGASAASPSYVGRWADTPDSCRSGEVITLTLREMHLLENGLCRFQKIVGGSGQWHTTMTCAGEGSTDRVSADLVVKDDILSVIYGKPYNTTAKFKRCGASGTATAGLGKPPAVAAAAQQMPETPRNPVDTQAYRAKAMAFLVQDIADQNPKISLDLIDLNGDGIPEALARIESPSECGTRGCSAFILDLSGPTARSIGDFTAQSLKALPTKTGAWRDVALNGIKQSFHAGKYVSAR